MSSEWTVWLIFARRNTSDSILWSEQAISLRDRNVSMMFWIVFFLYKHTDDSPTMWQILRSMPLSVWWSNITCQFEKYLCSSFIWVLFVGRKYLYYYLLNTYSKKPCTCEINLPRTLFNNYEIHAYIPS